LIQHRHVAAHLLCVRIQLCSPLALRNLLASLLWWWDNAISPLLTLAAMWPGLQGLPCFELVSSIQATLDALSLANERPEGVWVPRPPSYVIVLGVSVLRRRMMG